MTMLELRRIREWMSAEEGRENEWELPLIAEAVVDDQGNTIFRRTELTFGAFDGWDVSALRFMGEKIREFTGAF